MIGLTECRLIGCSVTRFLVMLLNEKPSVERILLRSLNDDLNSLGLLLQSSISFFYFSVLIDDLSATEYAVWARDFIKG